MELPRNKWKKKMYCVTVSEWKSVNKRLNDLENIVEHLQSKSKLFCDGNHNEASTSNHETQNFVETERLEPNIQTNSIISGGSDSVNIPDHPSSFDQAVQESLTLTSDVNVSGLKSASPMDSCFLVNVNASTSANVPETRVPSPTSSSCFPKGIGILDQNAFEKSRRAVISLKRCDETEVLAERPSFGSKNEQNKKNGSTANTAKRTRPTKLLGKPETSASHEKTNGKCNGSQVALHKRYKCLICTRKFTTKYNLSTHTMIHTGDKPYSCHVCAKRFNRKYSLQVHQRIHTLDRPSYACQFCPKACTTNIGLTTHVRVHTGEKPYQCQFCSKCFPQNSNLASHMHVHTGEKPFNCQYCPKTFCQRSNLKTHLRTHTREKPFMCHFCKRSFSFHNSLSRHLTLHTPGV